MKNLWRPLFLFMLSLAVGVRAIGQIVIQMEKDGGVYKIPCEINGLRLKLIFDTGASNVCISESIALMMLENGYIEKSDIRGTGSSVVADGRIIDNTKINIHTLKIGEVTINNVEAVVIHQQSAPLLLGQSAIQKLGKMSISGDKIILEQKSLLNTLNPGKRPSFDDIFSDSYDIKKDSIWMKYRPILSEAEDAYSKGLYELAVQYYSECYQHIYFDIYTKLNYAYSLRRIKKYYDALNVYNEIKKTIETKDVTHQINTYFGMMVCYHGLNDYNSCILMGQTALLKTNFEIEKDMRSAIICLMGEAYKQSGNQCYGKQLIIDEIDKYLLYKDFRATDCWDKNYRDSYLAELYGFLSGILDLQEAYKYIIISAAWGNKSCIELANQLSLPYYQRPAQYVY